MYNKNGHEIGLDSSKNYGITIIPVPLSYMFFFQNKQDLQVVRKICRVKTQPTNPVVANS